MRLLASLLMAAVASPLMANCIAPADYTGGVRQDAQQVVVLHRAPRDDKPGFQEMLIRVMPRFDGSQGPRSMAWVLTLPAEPVQFGVAGEDALEAGTELHERLYQLARRQWADRTQLKWPEALTWMTPREPEKLPDTGVQAGDTNSVGPYEITSIKGTARDLNEYLEGNGFPREDPARLAYFVDNDFTFLCVHVTPPAGEAALGKVPGLPPLVVSFETDRPYYPARYSDGHGNFSLDLTLITDTPLHTRDLDEQRRRLRAFRRGYVHLMNLWTVNQLPDELAGALTERIDSDAPERWYLNRIESEGFNEDGAISDWEDDVFFKVGESKDAVAGFWYYGDTDVSGAEKFFREHAIAMIFTFAFLLFGSIFIKSRINRRRLLQENRAD